MQKKIKVWFKHNVYSDGCRWFYFDITKSKDHCNIHENWCKILPKCECRGEDLIPTNVFLKKNSKHSLKSRDFGLGLLALKGLFLQIAKQHHYYKIILLSYMSYCHLIQNPSWDASQWCHIKKLKKIHWAWTSGFFFFFF